MNRWLTAISLVIIVLVGFYSKFYQGVAAPWVNNSLGGIFYEIFWCLLLSWFFPRARPFNIILIVFTITSFLEFLQNWKHPLLELIRSNFLGVTLIGCCFDWSDFIYYFLGCLMGWIWLISLKWKE